MNEKTNDRNKIALWITVAMILLSTFENIYRIEKFLYIAGVIGLFVCLLKKRKIALNHTLCILLFVAYICLTCLWTPSNNITNSMITVIATYLFLYLQLQFEYTEKDYIVIKRAFIMQGLLLLLLCQLFGTYYDNRFWISTDFSGADPNYLSGWFILPICLSIEELIKIKKHFLYKIILVISVFGLFYYIMQSGSRSGLLVNGIMVIGMILWQCKDIFKRKPILSLILLIFLCVLIFFVISKLPRTMIMRLLNSKGLGGRSAIWSDIFVALRKYPFAAIFGMGHDSVVLFTFEHTVAHNTILDIWFNYGLVGLSFILLYIYRSLRRLKDGYVKWGLVCMGILIVTLSSMTVRFFLLGLFMIGLNKEISANG